MIAPTDGSRDHLPSIYDEPGMSEVGDELAEAAKEMGEDFPRPVDEKETPSSDELAAFMDSMDTPTVAGVKVRIRRLKTREMLLGIRVLTAAMGQGITRINLFGDQEEVGNEIMMSLMIALPYAPDEFIQLVNAMVEPVNPREEQKLRTELDNPDPEDIFTVIQAVVLNEKDNMEALVGKLKNMVGMTGAMMRTGKKDS